MLPFQIPFLFYQKTEEKTRDRQDKRKPQYKQTVYKINISADLYSAEIFAAECCKAALV